MFHSFDHIYTDAISIFAAGKHSSLSNAIFDVISARRYMSLLPTDITINLDSALPEPETTTPDKR